jgi:hypothetical protein
MVIDLSLPKGGEGRYPFYMFKGLIETDKFVNPEL